mmetsp:Transcript_48903/g.157397  ORF Transcript_48903/g.157397 Transcript_48903/m.157397 type:complete len:160 (-) Transcript_48903:103-582(-)
MRDLLCLERPRALHADRSMYATPALLGALLFVLLSGDKYYAAAEPTSPVPLPAGAEYFVPWLFCLLLRAAAWTFRLALPHWARKRQSIFDLRGSLSLEPQKPQFQVALTPAEGHNSIADRVGRLLLGPKQRRRFGLPQLLVPKGRRGRRKVPPPADEFD